jgi:hypothetical protein
MASLVEGIEQLHNPGGVNSFAEEKQFILIVIILIAKGEGNHVKGGDRN